MTTATWRFRRGSIMFHLTMPSGGTPVAAIRRAAEVFLEHLRNIGAATALEISTSLEGEDAIKWTDELDAKRVAQRGPQDTKNAAEGILDRELWDPHLTAFALTLLYDRDPESGIRRMESLAATCADPQILTAMIENILSDPERFRTTGRARLAHVIAQRVAALDPEAFDDVEQRDKFLSMFGNASA